MVLNRFSLSEYLALFGFICLTQSLWVWPSLYFQTHSVAAVMTTLATLYGLIAGASLAAQFMFGIKTARRLLQFAIVSGTLLWTAKALQTLDAFPHLSDLPRKLFYLFAVLLSFGIFWLTHEMWQRACRTILTVGLIFMFFPWAYASLLAQTVYWPSASSARATTQPLHTIPPQKTLVLLLDELSFGRHDPIIEALESAGLKTEVKAFKPAGPSTLAAIPAIFLREPFDDSAPCGITKLCSGSKVIDFSRIQTTSSNIDVVGFYHRYCEIRGLRHCSNNPYPNVFSSLQDILCRVPVMQKFVASQCKVTTVAVATVRKTEEKIWRDVMLAPFWKDGGLLYVHADAPHPMPSADTATDLTQEYQGNLERTAKHVRELAELGIQNHGGDFKMIIYSDHPLRPVFWCQKANPAYSGELCDPTTFKNHNQIPIIVASVEQPQSIAITSIMNVFDLLFAAHEERDEITRKSLQ